MDFSGDHSSSASVASTLSWNTGSSRTRISTLSSAAFSNQGEVSTLSLDGVIQTVKSLNLRQCLYNQVRWEEKLGEGETFIVHRCELRSQDGQNVPLAIKHLKVSTAPDDSTYRRRLKSVILELRIMRHPPLRAHPNITDVFGYGWHKSSNNGTVAGEDADDQVKIMPYLLVPYAVHRTFREYLSVAPGKISIENKEILLGDVASAIAGLHACGIVHGDTKLDNVLVFDSWDRPSATIAKLADFGHSIVLGNTRQEGSDEPLRYTGTFPYNAPEVRNQQLYPIPPEELHKCDIWSFGLLIWETFLDGEEYFRHIVNTGLIQDDDVDEPAYVKHPGRMLEFAKLSVPSMCRNGNPLRRKLFCAALAMTLQVDPSRRRSDLAGCPFMSTWHSAGSQVLQATMALHLGSSEWSYYMFRQDTDQEIAWEHEVQIFTNLRTLVSNTRIRDSAEATWQLALCYHLGFGTSPSSGDAFRYAYAARTLEHPVARVFGHLLQSDSQSTDNDTSMTYLDRIKSLLEISTKDGSTLTDAWPSEEAEGFSSSSSALSDSASTTSETCSCTPYHRISMFDEGQKRDDALSRARFWDTSNQQNSLQASCAVFHTIHPQWPTQLTGTPLAFTIAVNDITALKYLLDLGANPLDRVYREGRYPALDPRCYWSAFHLAAKHHCPDALRAMLNVAGISRETKFDIPLGCSLSYSSPLERRAMHGPAWTQRLRETVVVLQSFGSLPEAAPNGMTAIAQAIDFHDVDVFSTLVDVEPILVSLPLVNPRNTKVYNLPIHFAAQMAARRDVPGAARILEIIHTRNKCLAPQNKPPMDSMNRTPLHMAVTGPSSHATKWLLQTSPGLLNIEDDFGRTALHCCASGTNAKVLLAHGANIDHTDKAGMTALHMACFNGNIEIVQTLLSHTEKPNLQLKNNNYGTPLHCAIINGSLEIVIALLKAEPQLDMLDRHGNAPIHVAVRMKRDAILRMLVGSHGRINTAVLNGHKQTAENVAARMGHHVALRILGSRLADLHDLDSGDFDDARIDIEDGTVENFIELSLVDQGGDVFKQETEMATGDGEVDNNHQSLDFEQVRRRALAELTYNLAKDDSHSLGFQAVREAVNAVVLTLLEEDGKDLWLLWNKLGEMYIPRDLRIKILRGVVEITHPAWYAATENFKALEGVEKGIVDWQRPEFRYTVGRESRSNDRTGEWWEDEQESPKRRKLGIRRVGT